MLTSSIFRQLTLIFYRFQEGQQVDHYNACWLAQSWLLQQYREGFSNVALFQFLPSLHSNLVVWSFKPSDPPLAASIVIVSSLQYWPGYRDFRRLTHFGAELRIGTTVVKRLSRKYKPGDMAISRRLKLSLKSEFLMDWPWLARFVNNEEFNYSHLWAFLT